MLREQRKERREKVTWKKFPLDILSLTQMAGDNWTLETFVRSDRISLP